MREAPTIETWLEPLSFNHQSKMSPMSESASKNPPPSGLHPQKMMKYSRMRRTRRIPVATRVTPIPDKGSSQLNTTCSTSPTTPKYARCRRTLKKTNNAFLSLEGNYSNNNTERTSLKSQKKKVQYSQRIRQNLYSSRKR